MITHLTYRAATFPSMAAFEAARKEAEGSGWTVSAIERHGRRIEVLFACEQEVTSTGAAIRRELPAFASPRSEARAAVRRFSAAIRLARRWRSGAGEGVLEPGARAPRFQDRRV